MLKIIDDIKYIKNLIKGSQQTVALSSAWSSGEVTVRKAGGNISLRLNNLRKDTTAAATICTLPAEYRPSKNQILRMIYQGSSAIGTVEITVTTEGVVSTSSFNIAPTYGLSGEMSWGI